MTTHLPLLAHQFSELDDSTLAIHQYETNAQQESWGYTLRRIEDGSFRLDLTGRGRENWLPSLSHQLYQDEVNVLSGHMYISERGAINGRLVLEAGPSSEAFAERNLMDYVSGQVAVEATDSISLFRYGAHFSELHGGSVDLEIEGLDRCGFLKAFFDHLAPLGLRLVEARISTVTREVRDRFWFELGDARADDVIASLQERLEPLIDVPWAT